MNQVTVGKIFKRHTWYWILQEVADIPTRRFSPENQWIRREFQRGALLVYPHPTDGLIPVVICKNGVVRIETLQQGAIWYREADVICEVLELVQVRCPYNVTWL